MTVIYQCFKAHYIFMSDFKETVKNRRNGGGEARRGKANKRQDGQVQTEYKPAIRSTRRNHGGMPHQKIHNGFFWGGFHQPPLVLVILSLRSCCRGCFRTEPSTCRAAVDTHQTQGIRDKHLVPSAAARVNKGPGQYLRKTNSQTESSITQSISHSLSQLFKDVCMCSTEQGTEEKGRKWDREPRKRDWDEWNWKTRGEIKRKAGHRRRTQITFSCSTILPRFPSFSILSSSSCPFIFPLSSSFLIIIIIMCFSYAHHFLCFQITNIQT